MKLPKTLRFLTPFLFLLFLTISAQGQTGIQSGVDLFEDGQLEQAKSFFENYLKSNKSDSEANFYLGRILFDMEEFGDATKSFEQAAKYEKGNSKYHMWLGHSFGRRAQNAPKLKLPGLARNSKKNYEKAIEYDPSNVEARESAMEYYLQAPKFVGGGRDKAEEQAKAIFEIEKEAGYIAWGRVYSYFDEDEKAVQNYNEAIESYPELMRPYYSLYSFHFNNQEYGKAAEIAKKQLAVNDTTAAIYNNLGNALQRDSQYEEAYEAYQNALEADSEYYNTYYQIGRLAAISGSYLDEGEEYLNRFLNADLDLTDNFKAWTYYRLGTIYEKRNNPEIAKTHYQTALSNDKDHKESKEALDRLK
ncbi:MAG: hypothetical protein ED557_11180 [Balneola sp.]|nr:MAG: hypothetical protein ED557_11180 [Balneola sp.]